MNRSNLLSAAGVILLTAIVLPNASHADFEVTAPDGRRVLLKDDGTWRYVEKSAAVDKVEHEPQAVLTLERRVERGLACKFIVRLTNNLPYEIHNLVPFYSAYRADGVLYDTVSAGSAFAYMKPGNSQTREIDFHGIACKDIARVRVVGGDRCVMGDLHRFSEQKGQCLARVRVAESEIVRFDK